MTLVPIDSGIPPHGDRSLMTAPRRPADVEPLSPAAAAAALHALSEQAHDHKDHRLAPATTSRHASAWAQYEAWCHLHRVPALQEGNGVSPQLVGLYVTDLARQVREDGMPRYKASSLKQHVASISRKHFEATGARHLGAHEAISDVVGGIERQRADLGEKRQPAAPLLLVDVKKLIADMDHDLYPAGVAAARDTLLLLMGFATAMRRSELAGLSIGQTVRHPTDGIIVHLGKSKGDQTGEGVRLPLPYSVTNEGDLRPSAFTCGPCAWVRWLRLLEVADTHQRAARMALVYATPSDPTEWVHVCREPLPQLDPTLPLFRRIQKAGHISDQRLTGQGVNAAIQRRLQRSGYDVGDYSAHSLRAGMITQARRNGADYKRVRRTSRHKSDAMIDIYDGDWNPLEGAGVVSLGL